MSTHPWLSRALVAVSLSASVAVAFGETWRGGFFMDDHFFLRAIHEGGGFSQVAKDLTGNWLGFSGYAYYRPLVTASFAIDHACFGLDARGYHLANLILHALNALLVYVLIRRIYPVAGLAGAFVTALLFAVNPVHPNAVGWVAARSDLLAGAFTLATVLCFQRQWDTGRRRWLVAALVAFAAALGAKESGAVAVALAVVVPGRAGWRVRMRGTAAAWPMLGAYFVLRLVVLDEGLGLHGPATAGGASETMRLLGIRFVEQLGAAALPLEHAGSWVGWLGAALATSAVAGLIRSRGFPVLAFSAAMIVLGIAPITPILRNLDTVMFAGFSRYWYLAVIGLVTIAALAVGGARRFWPVPVAACLVLAVVFTLASRSRSEHTLIRPARIARDLAERVSRVPPSDDAPAADLRILLTSPDDRYGGVHVNPLAFTSASVAPFVPRTTAVFPMRRSSLAELIRRVGGHRSIQVYLIGPDGRAELAIQPAREARWRHETTDGPYRLEPGIALDIDAGERSPLSFDVCRVKGVVGTGVIRVSVEIEMGAKPRVCRWTEAVDRKADVVEFDFRDNPTFLLAEQVTKIRVERLADAGPERHPTPVDEDMMIAGVEIGDRPVRPLLAAPAAGATVPIAAAPPALEAADGVSGGLGVRWITAFGVQPPFGQLPVRIKEGIPGDVWKQMVVSANFGSGWVVALADPASEWRRYRYPLRWFRVR